MEALIHHFKMVTQGVGVPAGRGLPGGGVARAASSASTSCPNGEHRPYRVKIRDPSFVNLQAIPTMVEGYLVADAIAVERVARPRDGRGGPLMALFEGDALDEARRDHRALPAGRERSAIMPLLYLAQSIDGHGHARRRCSEVGGAARRDDRRGRGRRELLHDATGCGRPARTCDGLHEPRVRAAGRGGRLRGRAPRGGHPHGEEMSDDGAVHAARGGVPRRVRASRRWCRSNFANHDGVTPERMAELVGALRAGEVPEPSRGPAFGSFRAASRCSRGSSARPPRGRRVSGVRACSPRTGTTRRWSRSTGTRPRAGTRGSAPRSA